MKLQEAYQVMQDNCGIEVGDTVKLLRRAKQDEMGWDATWNPYMSTYIGSTAAVKSITRHGIGVFGWSYPFFVLELVKKAEKFKTVKLNKEYTAEVHAGHVKVGCQNFSFESVLELAKVVQENGSNREIKYHNPDKLTDSQVQTDEGWRLLTKEEVQENQIGRFFESQWWRDNGWSKTSNWFSEGCTLRTKLPLPDKYKGCA